MDKPTTSPQAIIGGLLVLCSVRVDRDANRLAFTPIRLFNSDQPTQDWRGIKVHSSSPMYLEARDSASLDQLVEQFPTDREYGMQVGPVPANLKGGDQHNINS